MKPFNIYIAFCFFVLMTFVAQAQSIHFRNVLGNNGYDYGVKAQQTKDKGYIICGSTTSIGYGNSDIYVIKTDSLGKPVKERTLGGSNIDRGTCIKQTADSGYIVLGYTNSFGNGAYDIYMAKINHNLDVEWEKTYGGSDWDFGYSVASTNDGGYIVCGGTYSFGYGDEDYYLIKTNNKGDTLWTKTYGGITQDEAKAVVQTIDGGYVLTGFSMSNDTLGDFYTIKTNSAGDTLWTHTFGGNKLDKAYDIIERKTGNYVIAGETQSFGAGKSDGVLLEITSAGATNGSPLIIGNTEDDYFTSVCEREDGKIMFAGVTNSYGFTNGKGDIYFGVFNSDWSYNMSTTFGSTGVETAGSVAPTADNAAIVCGTTTGFRNFIEDIYLVKTDTTGYSPNKEVLILTRIDEWNRKENQDFSIYPNPAANAFMIASQLPVDGSVIISVYSIAGALSKTEHIKTFPSEGIRIGTDDLPNGVYMIRIFSGEHIISKRVAVQHE